MDEKRADDDIEIKVKHPCARTEPQDFNSGDFNFGLEPFSYEEKEQPNIGRECVGINTLQISTEDNCPTERKSEKLKSCLLDDANSAEVKLDVGDYTIVSHHLNENYGDLLVKKEHTEQDERSSVPRIQVSFYSDVDSEESDSDVEEHKIALQFLTGDEEMLCKDEEPTAEALVDNNVPISDEQYDVILKNAELIINDLYDDVNKNEGGIPEITEGGQVTNESYVKDVCSCTCNIEFTRRANYLKHLRLFHAPGERTKRKHACKDRASKRRVDGRVGAESSEFNIRESTTSAQPLKMHICTDAGGKSFRCNICSSKYASKKRLEFHVGTHENRKLFKCTVCGYKCYRAESFKSHVHTHTGEKRSFKCSICSYKCSQAGNLKAHAQTHTEKESFKCYICDFKSTEAKGLRSHIHAHTDDEKSSKYTVRDYTCSYAGNLKGHVRTHTGEKPFKCTICDYRCSKAGVLKRHIRKHTGEKPFKCNIWDIKFSEAGNFKRHICTPTGEKPIECTICDYRCTEAGYLKRHMRIHTGEKPFKCTVCDFKSSQTGDLKTHVWTHTGEKPYKCAVCDFKCSQAGYLKTHVRRHTGEKPIKCFELEQPKVVNGNNCTIIYRQGVIAQRNTLGEAKEELRELGPWFSAVDDRSTKDFPSIHQIIQQHYGHRLQTHNIWNRDILRIREIPQFNNVPCKNP